MESENSPNPRLNDILADDMQKNPEDYYIWRTKKDDKVRSKHAEREGEIFNWHVPPEGGHPGEDYNCRCWAEPYKPERYKNKPVVVDVSGLDMFKELQKTLKPVDLNNKNFPQYAANDKANTASDAVYERKPSSNNNLNVDTIILRNVPQIIKEEGIVDYPYKDTKGYITVGAGLNVDDYEVFCDMPWLDDNNKPAQFAEIHKNYEKIQSLPKGKLPIFYKKYSSIHLSSETISDKVIKHLEKDIEFIKDNIPEFYKYPPIIQDVFIDFQYNTGNCLQFVRFRKWVNAKDLDKMIEESFRPDVGKSRNDSIAARLRSNKDWDY